MKERMEVSSNPHIRSKDSTDNIMLSVVIALMPATLWGVWNFGWYAAVIIVVTVFTAVISEHIFCKICKKPSTVKDMSAVVTGLLLALNLPPHLPIWMAVAGAVFAIVVVKMLFGGLGQNFMNPALGARCFLLISFARYMTDYSCDAYTGATPLAVMDAGNSVNIVDMVIGRTGGTIGEVSMVAILLGACFLIARGVIDLKIPAMYILSFSIILTLLGGHGFDISYLSAHVSGGGLMLGAFFMATDYTTRPITQKGQYIYGILLGVLTGIFRLFGPATEGVSYAIIIGNLLVPLIEKITFPKPFGKGGEVV